MLAISWFVAACGWARTKPEPNQQPLDRKGAVLKSNYSKISHLGHGFLHAARRPPACTVMFVHGHRIETGEPSRRLGKHLETYTHADLRPPVLHQHLVPPGKVPGTHPWLLHGPDPQL